MGFLYFIVFFLFFHRKHWKKINLQKNTHKKWAASSLSLLRRSTLRRLSKTTPFPAGFACAPATVSSGTRSAVTGDAPSSTTRELEWKPIHLFPFSLFSLLRFFCNFFLQKEFTIQPTKNHNHKKSLSRFCYHNTPQHFILTRKNQ